MSHAALDPSRSIFRAPGIDGLICYLPTPRCAAVMGDPVCAPLHKATLADEFAAYCADSNRTILCLAAQQTCKPMPTNAAMPQWSLPIC